MPPRGTSDIILKPRTGREFTKHTHLSITSQLESSERNLSEKRRELRNDATWGITRTACIPHKIRGHALACVAVEVGARLLSLRGSCRWSFARRLVVVLNDALQKGRKGKQ